jgi:PAS domain S-box-containing protein
MSGSGATVGETTAPLPVAQIVMDVDGTIVDFDAAAESLLGYSRDEALGRQASDLVIPGRLRPAHDAGLRRYREPGEAPLLDNRFELPALRRDGTEIMIDLIVDCADPERLASFWSQLLGRPVAARTGAYVWLARGNGPGVGFQKVTEPRVGKNRIHFDVASPDPAAEQERVVALGGRLLQQYAAGGFLVMADPEENEFCIIPQRPFELDDDGRASYLNDNSTSPQSA